MNIYDLPKKWSATVGTGHLKAEVKFFVADTSDYGDTFGVSLKFIDKNLNPPNDDYWVVEDSIFIDRKITEKQVIERAIAAAVKFHNFLIDLMTNYGNNDTLAAWANYSQTLSDKLSESLGTIAHLEHENKGKTARIAELETDYIKKLETKIAEMQKERNIIIGTLETIIEGQKIIDKFKVRKGSPQW